MAFLLLQRDRRLDFFKELFKTRVAAQRVPEREEFQLAITETVRGADGDGKTYLAQAMAIAVSRGDAFLGMACLQSPVLYLDLENPAYVVQDRLQPMTSEESIPKLRIWGIWNEQQPPQYGSELLLTIAKETQPLIIIDPFRYFHNAKENDSDEMSAVMQYLRACARYGGAVVVMHHPAKTEGSTGRGSTAIRGACDLAFLQEPEWRKSNH